MDDLKEYVVALFSRCKDPVRQVELITELTGQELGAVLSILIEAGRVPKDVTIKNYKKVLRRPVEREITDELRQHIVASSMWAKEIARLYGIPLEKVVAIRREAYERVGGRYTDGCGTLKEFEARCPRNGKNTQRNRAGAGTGACRGRKRKSAAAG